MIQIADKAKAGPTESIVNGSEGEDGRDKKLKIPITQQYVDHTYTDYAIVEEDDLRLLDENSSLLPNPASSGEASAREKLKGMSCTYGPMKKNAGGVVQPFPGKVSRLSSIGFHVCSPVQSVCLSPNIALYILCTFVPIAPRSPRPIGSC